MELWVGASWIGALRMLAVQSSGGCKSFGELWYYALPWGVTFLLSIVRSFIPAGNGGQEDAIREVCSVHHHCYLSPLLS